MLLNLQVNKIITRTFLQLPQIYEFVERGTNSQNINESEEILKFGKIIRVGSSSVIVDIQWTHKGRKH